VTSLKTMMRLWSGLKTMSNFCIVCAPRSGSYWFMEYMCRTFDLVEGNEWFGRNKKVDLITPTELNTKTVDIDWTKNEDLLSVKDIKRRRKHLENFPFPYCIKIMPLQLTNTVEQQDLTVWERAEIAYEILEDFDLIWFKRRNKISHFCFELTAMHCSMPDCQGRTLSQQQKKILINLCLERTLQILLWNLLPLHKKFGMKIL
jgi:hypothetical protein